MKKQVGVWIDHKRACIMDAASRDDKAVHVVSNAEYHRQQPGELPQGGGYEPQKAPADSKQQRSFMQHLNEYYDTVVAQLRDAQSIMIYGPGEAKLELKKRIEKYNLGSRISGMETTDKLTNSQLASKIRTHFLNPT